MATSGLWPFSVRFIADIITAAAYAVASQLGFILLHLTLYLIKRFIKFSAVTVLVDIAMRAALPFLSLQSFLNVGDAKLSSKGR